MNDRKHNSTAKPVDQLAQLINKTVRNRIMSTKYCMKPKLQGPLSRWFEAHVSLSSHCFFLGLVKAL